MEISEDKLIMNVEDVLYNVEIDVVIEVMGGVEEIRDYILIVFCNKKYVVMVNKDLMVVYGLELLIVVFENNCDLFYEVSVVGGILIFCGLVDGLVFDCIMKMMGIVNGIINFILMKMIKEGSVYDEVLKEV